MLIKNSPIFQQKKRYFIRLQPFIPPSLLKPFIPPHYSNPSSLLSSILTIREKKIQKLDEHQSKTRKKKRTNQIFKLNFTFKWKVEIIFTFISLEFWKKLIKAQWSKGWKLSQKNSLIILPITSLKLNLKKVLCSF